MTGAGFKAVTASCAALGISMAKDSGIMRRVALENVRHVGHHDGKPKREGAEASVSTQRSSGSGTWS